MSAEDSPLPTSWHWLLAGQRRAKVAKMRWNDIKVDGTWTIQTEPREKHNPGALQLPQVALDIINRQVRYASNDFVAARAGATCRFGIPRLSARSQIKFRQALGATRSSQDCSIANVARWRLVPISPSGQSAM